MNERNRTDRAEAELNRPGGVDPEAVRQEALAIGADQAAVEAIRQFQHRLDVISEQRGLRVSFDPQERDKQEVELTASDPQLKRLAETMNAGMRSALRRKH